MIFKHSDELAKEIRLYNETMEQNEHQADAYNSYLKARSKRLFKQASEAYKKSKNPKESFLLSLKPYLMNPSAYCLDGESLKHIHLYDEEDFLNNAYYKDVHFPNAKKGNWELKQSKYESFEGFTSDEITVIPDEYYKEITSFGFFLKGFSYLEVIENGYNWMSVTPHEILTMKGAVAKAKGKVLTYGLGMGYYAFMASIKEDVDSVTIVERDENAIALFNEFILPQFPQKAKIHVVKMDAFEFAKNQKDGEFDYTFVDIWHLPFDGLFLYLQFKEIFQEFKVSEVDYWIERSILSLLRRALIVLISEEYEGSEDEDYDFASSETDTLINNLHFLLKKKRIATKDDLKKLLSEEELKAIAERGLI